MAEQPIRFLATAGNVRAACCALTMNYRFIWLNLIKRNCKQRAFFVRKVTKFYTNN